MATTPRQPASPPSAEGAASRTAAHHGHHAATGRRPTRPPRPPRHASLLRLRALRARRPAPPPSGKATAARVAFSQHPCVRAAMTYAVFECHDCGCATSARRECNALRHGLHLCQDRKMNYG
ncbi:unnamed protein product [Miscanthus lutarioriparius]|uniref:Uncharacterized protein n=1 Tax=Miscanthus lutarioriparius TaxID=422564 RepID=A0A811S3Q4_9POAL|nr:unnamed protein product [Miscanthus lutarioriparius]